MRHTGLSGGRPVGPASLERARPPALSILRVPPAETRSHPSAVAHAAISRVNAAERSGRDAAAVSVVSAGRAPVGSPRTPGTALSAMVAEGSGWEGQEGRVSHFWFLVEAMSHNGIRLVFVGILVAIIFGIVIVVTIPFQFQCVDMCSMSATSVCNAFGTTSKPASCVALDSGEWRSAGGLPDHATSKLRHAHRLVIGPPLGASLDTKSVLGSRIVALDAGGAVLSETETVASIANKHFAVDAIDGWTIPSGTAALALRFRDAPVWRTPAGNQSALSAISGATRPSLTFLMLSPWYVIFELTVRYVALLWCVAVLVSFLYSHYRLAQSRARAHSGLSRHFSLRKFVGDWAFVLAAHFVVMLFCDPIAAVTAVYPEKQGLRWWSHHATYAIGIAFLMVATIFTAITSGALFHVNKRWFVLLAAGLSVILPLLFLALEVYLLTTGSTVSVLRSVGAGAAAVNAEGERAESTSPAWVQVLSIIIFVLWFVIVAFCFIRTRNRLFWHKGARLYFGKVRLRVHIFRILVSCLAIFTVYFLLIYIPLQTFLSFIVPMVGRSGVADVVLAVSLTSLMMLLWTVRRIDSSRAPPCAQLGLVAAPDDSEDESDDEAGATAAPTGGDCGNGVRQPPSDRQVDAGDGSQRRDNGRRVPSRCRESVAVSQPRADAAESRQMAELQGKAKTQIPRPAWQEFEWREKHFEFLRGHGHSGYYFLYDRDKLDFDARHRHVPGFRSFFSFEMANACLSLSNEIYYDAPAESFAAQIEADASGCLHDCLVRALERQMKTADQKADEVEDMPESDQKIRKLSVEQFGYTLRQAFDVAGIQCAIAEFNPKSATQSRARAREPAAAPSETDSSCSDDYPLPTAAPSLQNSVAEGLAGSTTDIRSTHPSQAGTPTAPSEACARPPAMHGRDLKRRERHLAVVFRGTANIANAVTDSKVGRTLLEEMADRTRGRAKVHRGFEEAWRAMAPVVMPRIVQTLEAVDDPTLPLVLTGHSLGGALAVLCAYSFAQSQAAASGESPRAADADRGGPPPRPVQVYTYGMPRVGNEPFRREFDRLVPEAYRVVCENDSVATMGHCRRRHVGRRVQVDRDGNWLVEPNGVEWMYDFLGGGGWAIANHFLFRYAKAFDQVFANHVCGLRSFTAHEPKETLPGRAAIVTTSPSAGSPVNGSLRRSLRAGGSLPAPASNAASSRVATVANSHRGSTAEQNGSPLPKAPGAGRTAVDARRRRSSPDARGGGDTELTAPPSRS